MRGARRGVEVGGTGLVVSPSSGVLRVVAACALALVFANQGCSLRIGESRTDIPFQLASLPSQPTWARESVHLVEWDGTRFPVLEVAMIDVSQDSGQTWLRAGSVSAASGRFAWTVSSAGLPIARLRVTIGLNARETPDLELSPSQRKNYKWTKVVADAPFGARDGAGALVYDGKMWLIGGWNGGRFPRSTANDVWSSPDGVTWTEERPNTFLTDTFDKDADWEGRHLAGYEVYDGKMWILGGDPITGYYQRDVWTSTNGKKWTKVVDPAGFGYRCLHMSATFHDRLWVMGGQRIEQFVGKRWSEELPGAVLNDIWSSKDGASWTRVETQGPIWEPRAFVSNTAIHRGRLYVVGGGTYDDPYAGRPDREYRSDVWSTADGATWEKERETPPFAPRQSQNLASFDDRLWVLAGHNPTGNLGDTWYSADGKNWYETTHVGFLERHAASVWVHKGALFIGSGNAIDEEWRADVWRIDPIP